MNIRNQVSMKILMFVSSYFPLYIMLLILNIESYNNKEKILNLIREPNTKPLLFLLTMIIFILISIYSICDLKKTKGNEYYEIEDIGRPDDTVISYMMTYIIPLLTTDNLTKETILINLFLFLLIGYLYIRLNLIYLNPLWAIFGYVMYKTSNEMVIITNIPYRKINRIKNNRVKGTILAGNIYLVQKIDNDI